jgi:hypothetical protein
LGKEWVDDGRRNPFVRVLEYDWLLARKMLACNQLRWERIKQWHFIIKWQPKICGYPWLHDGRSATTTKGGEWRECGWYQYQQLRRHRQHELLEWTRLDRGERSIPRCDTAFNYVERAHVCEYKEIMNHTIQVPHSCSFDLYDRKIIGI